MISAALPQLSLGTAAVLIFGLFLTYVLLRGVGKLLIGTAMLTVSVFLGFLTWQKAPGLSMDWLGKSVGLITTGLPIVVFIGSFILIRLALRWVANPFGGEDKESSMKDRRGLSKSRMVFLLAITLIPTSLMMLVATGVIHHTASIHDLRQQVDPVANPDKTYMQQLKGSIEKIVPERILNALDPFAERSRLALAKLVSTQANEKELEPGMNGSHPPAVDPETGKVIPRAIIVEDAEIQRLARERKFGTLLRHPVITDALKDPEVRQLVNDLKH